MAQISDNSPDHQPPDSPIPPTRKRHFSALPHYPSLDCEGHTQRTHHSNNGQARMKMDWQAHFNVAAFSYKQMSSSGKSGKIKVLNLDDVQRKLKNSGIGIPYKEDSMAFCHWDEAALNLIHFEAECFEKGLQAFSKKEDSVNLFDLWHDDKRKLHINYYNTDAAFLQKHYDNVWTTIRAVVKA
ncbi:hypothetical protein GYMLUDRAFT_253358 [Collybiopsis luxurians FD-317 M1]|uniref:Uncharacterized protein n=1 Tax=Collybiopsis luxurians FD-317 M1 TaxID=944289 RepID=A0A0D0AIS1_9AGAR|nr:hypothetical protein GYMLUDRAFT_253358 [Collybiopsis luxurians FD-317 M1]